MIYVLEGEANEEKLQEELNNLVQVKWDFGVRRMEKCELSYRSQTYHPWIPMPN